MSPKLALKILLILIIVVLVIIFSFYYTDKLFLEKLGSKKTVEIVDRVQENTEEEKDEFEGLSEEEKNEAIEKTIEEKAEDLISNDKEDDGKISPSTRRNIEKMVNEEIKRKNNQEN